MPMQVMTLKNTAGQKVGGIGTLTPTHSGKSWYHMVLNFLTPALYWEAEQDGNVTKFVAKT